MRLHVHAAMGLSSFVMLLSGLGVGLGKTCFTHRNGVVITRTLVDGGMSNIVPGGGIDSVIGTLGDVYVLSSSSICVKVWGCSVGSIAWAAGT